MGSRRASSMTGDAAFTPVFWAQLMDRLLPPGSSRNGYGGAPEQQKQQTNITVHREKRSIEATQVVRANQRMLVGQQRRDDGNSRPSRPGQAEARRKPGEQRH